MGSMQKQCAECAKAVVCWHVMQFRPKCKRHLCACCSLALALESNMFLVASAHCQHASVGVCMCDVC